MKTRAPGLDRLERPSGVEHWFSDIFAEAPPANFMVESVVDMEDCAQLIAEAKSQNLRITYLHLLVRAVGLALKKMGSAHHMADKSSRLVPGTIDITVPVAGTGVRFSPLSVYLRDVGSRSLRSVAEDITTQSAALKAGEPADLRKLEQFRLLLQFHWLRRQVVAKALRSATWRREHMGTAQVSSLSTVDTFAPMTPFAGIIIGMGKVKKRPMVVGDQVLPRLTAHVSCAFDHRIWEGQNAAKFLSEVESILTQGTLRSELS
jgi:pyruvate/2-oxoglutarate dehydrogenase complex dihydrolipoamide acyltransferase (E2) component